MAAFTTYPEAINLVGRVRTAGKELGTKGALEQTGVSKKDYTAAQSIVRRIRDGDITDATPKQREVAQRVLAIQVKRAGRGSIYTPGDDSELMEF